MTQTIRIQTTVLPGHRIELHVPELPEGQSATVLVSVERPAPSKRPLREVLGDYPGGQLFKTAEEVEAYLREERDSWDK